MNRIRTSLSLPAARALLTLAGTVCLLTLPSVACAGTAEEGAPASQGDLLGRMPADAVTVGIVDFAAVRDSAFYEFARQEGASVEDSAEFQELIERTGMDPRTDLHRLGFVAGRLDPASRPEGAVILVASFDRERLEGSLQERPSVTYGEATFWELNEPEPLEDETEEEDPEDDGIDDEEATEEEPERERSRPHLVILDADTVAVGSRTMLERIVDVAGGAPSARSNERLTGLIEDVEADSDVWAVSAQDQMFAGLPGRNDGPTSQIPVDKVRSLILSIQLADGIEVELRGRTAREEDAQLLGDSLNGMLAFGKMMLQNNSPEIFAILDESVTAGSGGRDVTVRAALSIQELRSLREFARETFDEAEQEESREG